MRKSNIKYLLFILFVVAGIVILISRNSYAINNTTATSTSTSGYIPGDVIKLKDGSYWYFLKDDGANTYLLSVYFLRCSTITTDGTCSSSLKLSSKDDMTTNADLYSIAYKDTYTNITASNSLFNTFKKNYKVNNKSLTLDLPDADIISNIGAGATKVSAGLALVNKNALFLSEQGTQYWTNTEHSSGYHFEVENYKIFRAGNSNFNLAIRPQLTINNSDLNSVVDSIVSSLELVLSPNYLIYNVNSLTTKKYVYATDYKLVKESNIYKLKSTPASTDIVVGGPSGGDNGKIYPASMTKLATVIYAIDKLNSSNISNKSITVHKCMDTYTRVNSSLSEAGFESGDKVSYEDLFYGALYPSGFDAVTQLALMITPIDEAYYINNIDEIVNNFIFSSETKREEVRASLKETQSSDFTLMNNNTNSNTPTSNYPCLVYLAATNKKYGETMTNYFKSIDNGNNTYVISSNTNFINTAGNLNQNHITSLLDISKLTKYAINNTTFKNLFSNKTYSTSITNSYSGDSRDITLSPTWGPLFNLDNFEGGKSGHATLSNLDSGYNMTAYYDDGNRAYSVVTASALTRGNAYNDHGKIYHYLFNGPNAPTASDYCSNPTYNGSTQTIVKDAGRGFTWSSGSTGTNAGTYTVTAKLLDDFLWSDGTSSNKTITCSINKATPTITLSSTSGTIAAGKKITFNEKASVKGKFTVTSSSTAKATVSQASSNEVAANTNNLVTVTGVSAGSSTITVKFVPTDTTNYNNATNKTYTVTVLNTATIPTSASYCSNPTYNGSEQSIVKTAGTGFSWSSGNKQTNAGTYTVTASLSGDNVWSDGTTSDKKISCSMKKKDTTISVETKEADYTGGVHYGTFTADSGAKVTFAHYVDSACTVATTKENSGAYDDNYAPKDAGTYYVTGTSPATDNYNAGKLTCTKSVTINKKDIEVTWGETTSFTYNGFNQGPTATVFTGITSETMTLTSTKGKNVGSYTSTASCSSVTGGRAKCTNYNLTNNTKAYTILYKDYVITLDSNGGSGGTTTLYGRYAVDIYSNSNRTTSVTKITVPTKDGYVFEGYYDGGAMLIDSTGSLTSTFTNKKYNSDKTLVAKWTIEGLNITKYEIDGDYMKGMGTNTNISNFESNINSEYVVKVLDREDNIKTSGYIGTGDKVQIYLDNTLAAEYIAIIKGDITGDGNIGISDVAKLYRGLKKKTTLADYEIEAGNIIDDNIIKINDITKLYRYIKGKINSL